MAGEPNEYVFELWNGPTLRSLDQPDGFRRASEVATRLVPVNLEDGLRHKIYPDQDEQVMLVMRRIVRGLLAYHQFETAIPVERTRAFVRRVEPPEQYIAGFQHFNLGDGFCRYSIADLQGISDRLKYFMEIEFFGRTVFDCAVLYPDGS